MMASTAATTTEQAADAFAALGVLSTAAAFETGRASGTKNALMRQRVRESAAVSTAGHGVALRFLLAARTGAGPRVRDATLEVQQESAMHGDMVFL